MKYFILVFIVSIASTAHGDPKIRPLSPSDIDPSNPMKGIDENSEEALERYFFLEGCFHKLERPLTLGSLVLVAWIEQGPQGASEKSDPKIELFVRDKKTGEEGWLSLVKGESYRGLTFAQLEYHSGLFPEMDGKARKLGQTKTLSLGIKSAIPSKYVILRTFNGKMMNLFFWAKPASATQIRSSEDDKCD